MNSRAFLISRASRVTVGTMIGVGMLGLPFAVAQVGFIPGMIALIFIAIMSAIILELYADLVLVRKGKSRFIHVIGGELGHFGTFVATTAYIGSIYGALIAYCMFGGQFLRTVLFSWLPMTPLQSSLLFFVIGSVFTVGGIFFVARVQKILLPLFFLLIIVLAVVAFPQIEWTRFLTWNPEKFGLALGVMVFAFHAMSAIPEARDLLGRSPQCLPQVIRRSTVVVFFVYASFIMAVVGAVGTLTTEDAITGLNNVLGHSTYILASWIALLITISAFMNVSLSLVNTYVYDIRLGFASSWLLTMIVPIISIFLGVSSMNSVLNVTGGVLGSITAITMLIAYEKARMSAELPKRSLRVPQIVVGLCFCLFVFVLASTILG